MEKCLEAAGLDVDGWVVSSLASAEVVLTETEREMGVVMCDIGGGTTDLAIYIEGAVWHTAVIPVGGDHLTSDIAQGLHLPLETAEMVKRRHGHARGAMLDPNAAFAVRPFGQEQTDAGAHGGSGGDRRAAGRGAVLAWCGRRSSARVTTDCCRRAWC